MQQNYTLENYDLEGVLNNQYNKYSTNELKINGRGYLVYCPDTIDENTTFCIAGRGAGGLVDINSLVTTGTDRNEIVIAPVDLEEQDYQGAIDLARDIADKTGANAGATTYTGHSASGPLMTKAALNDLKEQHAAGEQTKAVLVLNDSTGERPILNSTAPEDVADFDGSLVIANVQSKYIYNDEDGNIKGLQNGCRLSTYDQDLEAIAEAGGAVVIAAYDIDSNDRHTDSVDFAAAVGLQKAGDSTLLDNNFSFVDRYGNTVICEKVDYYYYDTESKKWVQFPSAQEAQTYVDLAAAKVDLFNNGFLEKENDTYYLKTPDGLQEVSEMDIERMIIEYKNSTDEETKKMSLEDYVKNRIGSGSGKDSAEFNLVDTGRAVDTLAASLKTIGGHMQSLTNISGLNKQAKGTSKFLSGCPSFPSGVNTSKLSAASDCISRMGANLETAYNAALAVHNAVLETEGLAPTYFQSNTYANEATSVSTNTGNFADDHVSTF